MISKSLRENRTPESISEYSHLLAKGNMTFHWFCEYTPSFLLLFWQNLERIPFEQNVLLRSGRGKQGSSSFQYIFWFRNRKLFFFFEFHGSAAKIENLFFCSVFRILVITTSCSCIFWHFDRNFQVCPMAEEWLSHLEAVWGKQMNNCFWKGNYELESELSFPWLFTSLWV